MIANTVVDKKFDSPAEELACAVIAQGVKDVVKHPDRWTKEDEEGLDYWLSFLDVDVTAKELIEKARRYANE